jgi:muramoyltetrapeptide carboxypeptidase LdcA involved in peptidoglycan recycling
MSNLNIYLVAPSFGTTTTPYKERMNEALKVLKKIDANVVIGKNVFKADLPYASSNALDRANEIMEAFNSSSNIIWSVGGGEAECEILEYLDFEKLKNKNKLFIGYSDNTFLIHTLATICNEQSIYGPNAPSLYMYPFKYDILDTIDMINGKKKFYGYKSFDLTKTDEILPKYHFNKRKIITPYNYNKPFEGTLLGGCLDCLMLLCGTKFDNTKNYIKDKKIIFYLEACELTSIHIKRALFQLKNSGWFDTISGFIIGRSLNYYDKSFGITPKDAYIEALKEYNVPILLDVDLGHISPSLPIKNGAKAKISYIDNNIKIEYLD